MIIEINKNNSKKIVRVSNKKIRIGNNVYLIEDIINVTIQQRPNEECDGKVYIKFKNNYIDSFLWEYIENEQASIILNKISTNCEFVDESILRDKFTDKKFDANFFDTSEKIVKYINAHNLGYPLMRKMATLHFDLVLEQLQEDEKILLPFFAQWVLEKDTAGGTFAFAVTNKRLIAAKAKVLSNHVSSFDLDTIINISISSKVISGIISIETYKKILHLETASSSAVNIGNGIKEIWINYKNKESCKEEVEEAPNINEIKKYKELLDLDIITQEEFNKKKKELLGL